MKYWGVLIGLYTGTRLNEIASLTVHDVKQEGGIWYFDINDEDEKKRLKTKAATRLVPVHSELIRRGFLDYVERVRKMEGDDLRLLYSLTYTEQEGWGRKLSRWFSNTFLPELGLKKVGLSFHSLRHTAITTMRQASVDNHIVRNLVGHEPDGVTEEVYMHDYKLAWLQMAQSFNQQIIYANMGAPDDEPEPKQWTVLPIPTGSGKTQGLSLYCAMRSEGYHSFKHPGILIITRMIGEADDLANRINELSKKTIAVAYHSKSKPFLKLSI